MDDTIDRRDVLAEHLSSEQMLAYFRQWLADWLYLMDPIGKPILLPKTSATKQTKKTGNDVVRADWTLESLLHTVCPSSFIDKAGNKHIALYEEHWHSFLNHIIETSWEEACLQATRHDGASPVFLRDYVRKHGLFISAQRATKTVITECDEPMRRQTLGEIIANHSTEAEEFKAHMSEFRHKPTDYQLTLPKDVCDALDALLQEHIAPE